MTIAEGKMAPLFTLKNQQGHKVALKEFKGKDVIVYFYPQDDTPGCTKEACCFRDNWQVFRQAGIVVLGISPDDEATHQKFIDKYDLPFTLLSDPNKKVMEKYAAWGEKNMYGRIVTGVIRSTVWIDTTGKIVKHWRRVPKAADHPEKILQAMKLR